MLYDNYLKREHTRADCLTCEYFDKQLKVCNGLNKKCFEYDEKTKTIIDGITKMPVNKN
jgi:hypothetical protein